MKPSFLFSLLLLAVFFLSSSSYPCLAQESGRFQGNIKGSGLGIYWTQHHTADISLGWRFNDKRYLGIGTGCHWIKPFARGANEEPLDFDFVPAIPVFADYVRYFPFARHPQNSFFLGLEGGAAWYLKALPENSRYPNDKLVPYLNGKLGFDFGIGNRFGINVGLNLIWGLGHGVGLSSEGGHGLAAMVGFRF